MAVGFGSPPSRFLAIGPMKNKRLAEIAETLGQR
jgi:hypothetical protein